ncbi:MAG TPA: UDP-2,3-diacylglucosamine diphosphatase [Thermoanaerobaculia bacterium]|nr:UDP-2,3-diacylglucosamine diphosphatase [Thermoanaerobaculia bacterium]
MIIGDSHIGLTDGAERRIVSWLDRLAPFEPRALYLNGDVFHYYIGDPKFYTAAVQNVMGKLAALRERGTHVHYVEGNRDFFVRKSLAESAVSEISDDAVVEAGGRKFFVVHGDMINDRDWPYRFWRRMSKNPITKFGVKLWPKGPARRFVDRVERRLKRANWKHKQRLPVELMEAYGRRKGEQGYDVVVFGHFHQKLELPAGRATVAVLPAWYETEEAMVIDPATGGYRFVRI